MDAAREADDGALGAYLVGSLSTLPTFRGDPNTALQFLQHGTRRFSINQATPTTRAWLHALEAEAHSTIDDDYAALRALEQAEGALDRAADEEERPRVRFFDRARLAGERGIHYVHLGRSEAAEGALREALASVDPSSKIRSRILTNLAFAHVQQGDIEEAARLAGNRC
jgi:tetratricopeptide (TPR) repeat protein